MQKYIHPPIIFLFILIAFSCQKELIPLDKRWKFVSGKRELSISGISPTSSKHKYLVVHDNKKKDQLRAGLIDLSADSLYMGLDWPTEKLPIDLEALSNIPGYENEYIAMGSWGFCYWIKLDLKTRTLDLINEFRIPDSGPPLNLESFQIFTKNNNWYAAWAHRGSENEDSILFWGSISLLDKEISISIDDSVFVNVPWPVIANRHMSDMIIEDNRTLWSSATSDPGDEGPYASAIYKIGTFNTVGDKMKFNPSLSLESKFIFQNNKVEAMTINNNNKMVFATDDENLGSAINITIDEY